MEIQKDKQQIDEPQKTKPQSSHKVERLIVIDTVHITSTLTPKIKEIK